MLRNDPIPLHQNPYLQKNPGSPLQEHLPSLQLLKLEEQTNRRDPDRDLEDNREGEKTPERKGIQWLAQVFSPPRTVLLNC